MSDSRSSPAGTHAAAHALQASADARYAFRTSVAIGERRTPRAVAPGQTEQPSMGDDPKMTPIWRSEAGSSSPVKLIAKTLFRELCQAGYTPAQIVSLSTELTDMVTNHLREQADHGKRESA